MQQEQQLSKIRMVLVGNTNVGKSAFLEQVFGKTTTKVGLTLNLDLYTRKIQGITYQIKVIEVTGADRITENANNQSVQVQVKNSDIALIFLDVSNKQSFDDVARGWLRFVNQVVQPKNQALLVHKIDKDPVMALKNIFEFAAVNKLQVFFSSSSMNCKKIFDDVILWSESNAFCQSLTKDKQQPKKENFLKRFLGIGNSQNEDEGLKNKIKQICQTSAARLSFMQKSLLEAEREGERKASLHIKGYKNQIRGKLSQIYGILTKGNDKEPSSPQKLLVELEKKLKSFSEQKQKINAEKVAVCSQLSARKSSYEKKMDQLSAKNIKMSEECKYLKKQFEQKVKILENELMSAKSKAKGLQEQLDQQIEVHRNNLLTSTIADEATSRDNEQKKARIWQLESMMKEAQLRSMLRQARQLLEMNIETLQQLRQVLEGYQGKQLRDCRRVYQFDQCPDANFHTFLDNRQKLLYIVSLPDSTLIIYAPPPFRENMKAARGIVMVWDKNTALRELATRPEIEICKYDPLCLVFLRGQVNIKFNKKQCSLWLIQKKISGFQDKQCSLSQLLGLDKKQSKQRYLIQTLQICQLDFCQL